MIKLVAIAVLSLITLSGCAAPSRTEVAPGAIEISPLMPQGYELSWSDEFEKNGLPDHRKWRYDTFGNKYHWWNGELQFHTRNDKRNAFVKDGMLVIQAREGAPETTPEGGYAGQAYTSARLITGPTKRWVGGFFEISARIPCNYGTWPVIWLLGVEPGKNWPDVGEIDIMEHVGQKPNIIHGTVHTGDYNHRNGKQRGARLRVPDACTSFHRYQTLWTEDKISLAVDDKVYFELENDGTGKASWPFDNPHYMILSLSIGGWGGAEWKKLQHTPFPQKFEIDYVRVFEKQP